MLSYTISLIRSAVAKTRKTNSTTNEFTNIIIFYRIIDMDNSKLNNNLNNNHLNLLIYEMHHAHININELNIFYF